MRRSDMDELENLIGEDPTEAIRLARKIVGEIPGDADAWGWLAEAQVAAGECEQALKTLAEYVRRDPDWIDVYALRAGLLSELGRFDAAAVELEVGRALDSGHPRLVRAEAIFYELQGQFVQADALYAKAHQIDALDEAPARFDRGKAKLAIGEVLKQVAKDGLKLHAVIEEVPAAATATKLFSRQLELRDATTVVVYLRNLERELAGDAELEDLAELFEDRLAELVQAN